MPRIRIDNKVQANSERKTQRHQDTDKVNDPSKVPEGKLKATEYIELSQAQRVINLFGGKRKLQLALEAVGFSISYHQLVLWTKNRDKNGTGGVIPPRAIYPIIEAARYEGVMLKDRDLDPRPLMVKLTHSAYALRAKHEARNAKHVATKLKKKKEKEALI